MFVPFTEQWNNYMVQHEQKYNWNYRVRINYRRISLRHNLSRKCRQIVKFVSITHSECNIWNGPIAATAISREKRKPVLEGKWLPHRPSVVDVSWNLRDVTVLWWFNARCDGNLDVVVVLRRWSEGGMNSFVTEDASVIKERVARRGQVLPKR